MESKSSIVSRCCGRKRAIGRESKRSTYASPPRAATEGVAKDVEEQVGVDEEREDAETCSKAGKSSTTSEGAKHTEGEPDGGQEEREGTEEDKDEGVVHREGFAL